MLTVSDSVGTITREYDKLNRVTRYTDVSDNIIEYGYDANGNLTSLIYPGGKTVTYGYDKANRLTTVTDWAYRETSYDYDANGRLVKTTRPNGSIMTIGYDAAGQMVWQNDVDLAGSGISRYEFTYDAMGNITVEESVYGNQFTLNNDYDAVYQILGQEKLDGLGSTVSQHSFGYDSGGNMTAAEEVYAQSETVMTYTYDNRLSTFNSQNVTYDADGNMTYGPLGGVMVTFNHDARNRLTGVGDFSYIYDAQNNRISVTETVYGAAYSTNYVINPNAALSQTLIKTDPDETKTFYIYGLGLIGEETDGVYRSYHYDFRGSTVALTDSDGDVTDRYSYGPYGELLTHTGTTSTPFLYNGRDGVMTDDNGLYFMRARYYNPEIKRFITRDEFEGRYDEILNINLYEYADNNPVMNIDPKGEVAWWVGAALGGAAFDAGLYAWEHRNEGFSWKGLGKAATRGAITGVALGGVGKLIGGVIKGSRAIKVAKGAGSASQFTKSTLKLGQEMHKAYKADLVDGLTKFKEYRLPSGKRIDFIDFETKTIYELKPYNPRAMKGGEKQLQQYLKEVEKKFGDGWKVKLDTY